MERVLLVDDEKEIREIIASHLRGIGYVVDLADSGEAALDALNSEAYSVVLTDVRMNGMHGLELCDRIAANFEDLPVLIMTAFGTLDVAVEAIRAGAFDFIVKPLNFATLAQTVEKAVRSRQATRLAPRMKLPAAQPELATSQSSIIGESGVAREIRATIQQLSNVDAPVLLTGESGTGKEHFARALHQFLPARAALPFEVINCTMITESSIQLELLDKFGPDFSGTIFLDDILHFPLSLQPRLLRMLEDRFNASAIPRIDSGRRAHFIAATNEDLPSAVERGRFRADLFYRINVIHVRMSPLRERGNDVFLLARFFLDQFARRHGKSVHSLSTQAIEKLLAYAWPGNVRELRNCLERAVSIAKFQEITVEDLPEEIRRYMSSSSLGVSEKSLNVSVDEVEKRHILAVLREVGGNKALAAKILKMDRKTLYRKLERYSGD
jgi:two-component system, NtrC family, response regulator AtoC